MIGTSTSTKVKISNILDSQILDFIQEENPDFKDFLNQYYISEEHEFGSTYLSDNLASLKNIGDTSNNILNVNINNKLTSDINAFDDEIFVTTTNGYPDQYGLFKILVKHLHHLLDVFVVLVQYHQLKNQNILHLVLQIVKNI